MQISGFSRFFHSDDFTPAKSSARPSTGRTLAAGAIGGAAAGAVVGAGVGYLQGLDGLRHPSVTVTDSTYFSTTPHLVGASYDDSDMVSTYNSTTESWDYHWTSDDWDPIIQRSQVSPYQKPEFASTRPGLLSSVAGGAVKGAAIGAVAGAAGSLALRAAGVDNLEALGLLDDTGAAMLVGGAGGALVGGIAGYHAGQVAQSHAQVEVRTAPVYENRQIGWMPWERNASSIKRDLGIRGGDYKIYYNQLGGRYGDPPFAGQHPVYSQVPVGEAPKEFRSSALTPWTGAALGALSGGVLGVAAGAAASVIGKVLES